MKAYHEVSADDLATILSNGLKKTSRGEKGDDKAIKATDEWLDAHRPDFLKKQGVCRDDNVYGYAKNGKNVIDITDGTAVPLETFISERRGAVLELTIDPKRCFVSDLDAYDALKAIILHDNERSLLSILAYSYWSKIRRLDEYKHGSIRRPEIMVTYDIPARDVKALN